IVFLGLNMPLNLSTRGSGTSTTPVCTSMRPAEAVVGVLLRVSALKRVVLPDCGRPIIPSFILTFAVRMGILASNCRSGGIGRRARLKIVFRKECGFNSHLRHWNY